MMPAPPRTLASRIARRENADFVGRTRELLIVDTLFGPDAPASVLLVHGPAGIGKSVLLREIHRRGARAGWTRCAVDEAPAPQRPLVLIDDHEPARGDRLRTSLSSLSARAVVVVAGREAPEPGWFEGGWETVALELELGPLSDRESRVLLARHGLAGDPRAGAIARWAAGLPLALRLGASAACADAGWQPGQPAAPLRHLERSPLDPEAVRDALRNLHRPHALAGSPLAPSPAAVRSMLQDAADRAFGDTPDERLLRRVLVRGYFEPAPSHEQAARELHLSRAAYFRRLRSASERVAAWLARGRR